MRKIVDDTRITIHASRLNELTQQIKARELELKYCYDAIEEATERLADAQETISQLKAERDILREYLFANNFTG